VIVLDASVLIAHLSPTDVHHRSASALLADVAGEPLLAHLMTLAEVLVGGARASRAGEMLADLRDIGVDVAPRGADDAEALRLAELRASTGLKLPECCVLDTALTAKADLATFDQALADVARARGITIR
jgi:predicted nucleic acid-binding protein